MLSCHKMAALWYYCKRHVGPPSDYKMETLLKPNKLPNRNCIITHRNSIFVFSVALLWLEVMSPRLDRVSPLPLPVALFPPLWPGKAAISSPACLIVFITVRVHLSQRKNSVWENFFQLGREECLEAAPCLGHLWVGLWSEGKREITFKRVQLTDDDYIIISTFKLGLIVTMIINITVHRGSQVLTYIIELCAVVEHEIDISNKLIWWLITLSIPLIELGPDHRQVHWPLDDLVVMASLHAKAVTFETSVKSTQQH